MSKSVRKVVTVEIITTYCLLVIAMAILAMTGKITTSVFLAFISGFTSLAGMVLTFYFAVKKRPEDKNGTA